MRASKCFFNSELIITDRILRRAKHTPGVEALHTPLKSKAKF